MSSSTNGKNEFYGKKIKVFCVKCFTMKSLFTAFFLLAVFPRMRILIGVGRTSACYDTQSL